MIYQKHESQKDRCRSSTVRDYHGIAQRWIQKLHSLGLLPSIFLQDNTTTYCRHRANMMGQKADTLHKMQKFLKLLNYWLDVLERNVTLVRKSVKTSVME
ncbi:MAG: hypothetical protein ACJA1Z_000394 [Patiriisocius sp.]